MIDPSAVTASLDQSRIPDPQELDSMLSGVLKGYGPDFVQAGVKYGIDPAFLASVAMFETGGGSSPMAQNKNNIAGIYDSSAKTYKTFNSIPESIDFTAKNLAKNYLQQGLTTASDIGPKYAPVGAANDPNGTNGEWPAGVAQYYDKISGVPTVDASSSSQTPINLSNPDVSLGSQPIQEPFSPQSQSGLAGIHTLSPIGSGEGEVDTGQETGDDNYTANQSILADASDENADTTTPQPQDTQAAGIDYSKIITDPSQLKVVAVQPNGDIDYNDGSTLHPNGVVSIKADNQVIQAIPGIPKLHVVKTSQENIKSVTNKETGETSFWKLGPDGKTMVRVPMEGEIAQDEINIPKDANGNFVTGDAALVNLDAKDKAAVKEFADYKRPAPTGGRQNIQFNRLAPYIYAYKPSYKTSNFVAFDNLNKSLYSQMPNSGGGQIKSINTAIAHLKELYDVAQSLDNEKLTDVNKVENFFSEHSGDPRVRAFKRAKGLVDLELTRAFSGAAPDLASLKIAQDSLNQNESMDTYKNTITHLLPAMLTQRLAATVSGYKELSGEDYPNTTTPEAEKIMTNWGFNDFPALSGRGAPAAANAAPAATQGMTPDKVAAARAWLDSPDAQKPENAQDAAILRKLLGL